MSPAIRAGVVCCVVWAGAATILPAPPLSADAATEQDAFGTLNPDDSGRDMLVRKIDLGARDSVTCSLAFNATKYDDHPRARRIAELCAEAGNVKAMTRMSHIEANGIGAPADAGDPIGLYNHGLDLLRGSGVPRDAEQGRSFVDAAARRGLDTARALADAGYDLRVVTPDAEE